MDPQGCQNGISSLYPWVLFPGAPEQPVMPAIGLTGLLTGDSPVNNRCCHSLSSHQSSFVFSVFPADENVSFPEGLLFQTSTIILNLTKLSIIELHAIFCFSYKGDISYLNVRFHKVGIPV